MNTSIGKLKLKNPVMVASGTFGYGVEYKDIVDLNKLGAIVTKTITLNPRAGNSQPRIFEVPYGMINSVGLQNVGLKTFIEEKLKKIKKITKTPIIASIAGETISEYVEIAEILTNKVEAIELNLSCPNVKHGGGVSSGTVSQSAKMTHNLIKKVRIKTKSILIAKLSPATADMPEIAHSCEDAGADAVSLINSFPVIYFSPHKNKAPVFGGLSGPCIKHIALKLVYEVSLAVKIPIIGMGGIMTTHDALDFFKAGASFVAIGCANFVNPKTAIEIIDGLTPPHQKRGETNTKGSKKWN